MHRHTSLGHPMRMHLVNLNRLEGGAGFGYVCVRGLACLIYVCGTGAHRVAARSTHSLRTREADAIQARPA
jgi:hypothetical protein